MNKIIQERLRDIEKEYKVYVLYACESGSRAWNFASVDSDYDVRFVYIKDLTWYLSLDKKRDVIELPIIDEYDINGWDLSKFLKLLYKSNVVAFEWLQSPIVYRTSVAWQELNALYGEYFNIKISLYHYLSIAKNQHRLYLMPPHIKLKKFFYALRPLLAFLYIKTYQKPAPMDFLKLLEFGKNAGYVSMQVLEQIQLLYTMKIQGSEQAKTSESTLQQDILLEWISQNFDKCQSVMENLSTKESKRDLEPLNELFYSAITR